MSLIRAISRSWKFDDEEMSLTPNTFQLGSEFESGSYMKYLLCVFHRFTGLPIRTELVGNNTVGYNVSGKVKISDGRTAHKFRAKEIRYDCKAPS